MTTSEPLDGVVVVRTCQLGIEAVDRRGFSQVQRLALRNTFRNVEENNVSKFLQASKMSERTADLT